MPISISNEEIKETIHMIQAENLDIRTITMGISLRDCADSDVQKTADKVYEKIVRYAHDLAYTGEVLAEEYGVPIINKRVSGNADFFDCRVLPNRQLCTDRRGDGQSGKRNRH